MAKTVKAEPIECGELFPNRWCAYCLHPLSDHADMCEHAVEDEICGCSQWVDSGQPYIRCVLDAGPNATTDPVLEEQEDADGKPIIVTVTPPQPRHVHKGYRTEDTAIKEIVRWELSLSNINGMPEA